MTDFTALAAPFPPASVSWRIGSSNKKKRQKETSDQYAKATKGMALAYIDARDVMDRLDDVCGPDGWQCRYSHAAAKTICDIGIKVGDEWVWKADGAGDTDHEALKGALSDAFKRAAVRWGIGRYLYHISSPWVDLDERENIVPADLVRLRKLLTGEAPKVEAPKPEPKQPPQGLTLNDRADAFVGALNATTTAPDLEKAWAKGSKLCADLDTADPEKLAAITGLYEARRDELETNPFTDKKAA
jgi:hypothetical protein